MWGWNPLRHKYVVLGLVVGMLEQLIEDEFELESDSETCQDKMAIK